MWVPYKEEINAWVKLKERTFAAEENQNPNISTEEWLQRYLFTDLHEILFVKFLLFFMSGLQL